MEKAASAELLRDRAMTASSYASTAIPPVLDFARDDSGFEGGFRDILNRRQSALMDAAPPIMRTRSV